MPRRTIAGGVSTPVVTAMLGWCGNSRRHHRPATSQNVAAVAASHLPLAIGSARA
jgi:hypothetical protein